MRINQNISAMAALRNLSVNNDKMTKSLDKLSSGFRINRAADDAAGLVISEGLRSQVGGLKVAMRNAQDGISVVQTAEGALTEVHSILQRMRDLTVQSANTGTNGSAALNAMQAEVNALTSELGRITTTTKFNGVNLLDGSFGVTAGTLSAFDANGSIAVTAGDTFTVSVAGGSGTVTVGLTTGTSTGANISTMIEGAVKSALRATGNAVDATAADNFSASYQTVGAGGVVTFENRGSAAITVADGAGTPLADTIGSSLVGTLAAASGSGGVFQVGANVGTSDQIQISIADLRTSALNAGSAFSVTINGNASQREASATAIENAIARVSTVRGSLGAMQNRFEHTIANLGVAVENISASESRIRDVDMASEMANFTRNQIMTQAGTSMLAQANAVSQNVLNLLR